MALKKIPPPKPKKKTKRQAPSRETVKAHRQTPVGKEKLKRAALKRQLTASDKRIQALQRSESAVESDVEDTQGVEGAGAAFPAAKAPAEDEGNYAFKPNDGPQTEFLAAVEREVLYGGAAGGGKSMGMLADPIRYFHHPQHRGILFRRTNDALRELIQNSKILYPKAFPKAKWSEQKSTWTFPSGAEQWFTYLDRDDDVIRYQGQAFNWIGFDELTQWPTPYPWDFMRSRLRTTVEELPLSMRASTNPGGVGAWWVRKMFIDPAPWGQSFWARDLDTDKVLTYPLNHIKAGQPLFKRRFIPARLQDNPHLWQDGQYETNLLSLPEAQRRQLLEGDWDVVEGAAFPEFRRSIHTCDPFEIPKGWARFRAADWGYSSPACVLWFAVDWDGTLYVYRELYVKGMTADAFADRVLALEEGDNVRNGYLDSSTWSTRGETGPSIAETMIKRGCRWQKSDRSKGSRVSSKLEIHRRLVVRPTGNRTITYDENGEERPIEEWEEEKRPGLVIFSNCTNLIRTLPMLPLDKSNSEDVDTDAEDHAYDALRYGCASRPIKPRETYSSVLSIPTQRHSPADPVFGY